MNSNQIEEAFDGIHNGANIYVEWARRCKLRQAYIGLPLTKLTRMLCRVGVGYDNIAEVKEGRSDGTLPAENAGLRGFEWHDYPRTLRNLRNGELYLRLESGTFKSKTKKEYRLDGQVVNFDDYKHMMLASEMPTPKGGHLTFNVKISDIISIHTFSIADADADADADAEDIKEGEAQENGI